MKNCLFSRRTALTLALVFAFATSSTLYAQAPVRLADTVVIATRIAQPATEAVAEVSTLDRAEIERLGVSTVTQLLTRLPGLQTIGYGDSARVFIRGADSRMTALYIDGVRVDSQDGLMLGGGAPWDLVPLSQIERIEVLRGPASAVYGSDAMGGVVHIFTRRGEGAFVPYVNLGLGSFNAQKASAGFSGGQAGWTYALGLGFETSDGYNTRPDLMHTPDHEPVRQQSTSLRLGYQISAAHQVDVSVLDSQQDSRWVPWGGGADMIAFGRLTASALKWQAQWTDAYYSVVTASSGKVAKRDDAPNDYRTTSQGLLWENHLRLASGTVSAVLEQKRDAFDAQATTWDPSVQGDRTQNALALGYGAVQGPHSVQLNARNDRDSIFGVHESGAASYGYAFTPQWRATLSAGTAFRAPTLEQVFGPYGSAQLQPETNQSTELGVRYGSAATRFKAVAYRNKISNMISSSATLSTCAAGFFCYYNVGQASIEGVTLSGSHQYQNLEVHASVDFLDPRDDITGHVLSLRARRTATLGLEGHAAGWLWGADLRGVGERFDDAANTRRLAGYALLHLSATSQVSKDWRAVVRVDNATDQAYQEVGNYATPGRTFFVGLQWQPPR